MNKEEMKNKISMALKDPILQQGFECICKENAELEKAYNETEGLLDKQIEATYKVVEENKGLKERLKPENCLKLLAKEGYIKFSSDNLTKAKEIIEKLISQNRKEWIYSDVREEAEQFLKELEK